MFLLVLFLASDFAFASGNLCPSANELRSRVESCGDNTSFVAAADACLARIDAKSKAESAKYQALAASDVTRSVEAQTTNFGSNVDSMAKALAGLDELRGNAVPAREEMTFYPLAFLYPANTTAREAESLGLTKYFQKFPCYTGPLADLDKDLVKMDRKIDEIGTAMAALEKLSGTNVARSASLGGSLAAKPAPVRAPASTPSRAPIPAGNSPQRGSDITGTQKAIRDDNDAAYDALFQQANEALQKGK